MDGGHQSWLHADGDPRHSDAFVLVHLESPKPGDRLRAGSVLNGRGWIVAEIDVNEVAVYLDDAFIGYAFYGLARPEIGQRYPHFPQSEQSGFSFSFKLGHEPERSATSRKLVIRIRLADGCVREKIVTLHQEDTHDPAALEPGNAAIDTSPAGLWPIRMFADQARIDQQGVLRVRGWVASLGPLVGIRAFLGETPLGDPEVGKPRPDVAVNHPDYPNAASSGFELVENVSALPSTQGVLRIIALSAAGIRRQIVMPVEHVSSELLATDESAGITVCCDAFAARTDGSVTVEGWAIASGGVRRVDITLDGEPIGQAELGLSRPDVGNRYPRSPGARNSGFRFSHNVGCALQGEVILLVSVRTGDEREKSLRIPLRATEPGVADATTTTSRRPEDAIRLELDQPRLVGERAAEALRGTLVVSGWTVAPDGVSAVEVQVDDRTTLPAYVGTRREDVAASYPEIPDALFSGFAVTIPHRLIGEGEHTVRVRVLTHSGECKEQAFTLLSEQPEDVREAGIRPRLPQSAIDLWTSVLSRQRQRPTFEVVIRAPGLSAETRQDLSATLASLSAQAYADWRATIIAPSLSEPPHSLCPIVEEPRLGERLRIVSEADADFGWEASPKPARLIVLAAGDRLGADALLELALAIALDGHDFVYSDERAVDPACGAKRAHLKPGWSPDLLLATNYIGRLWCAARELVDAVDLSLGDIVERGEYDAVLRLTEKARSVGHVASVLCERGGWTCDSPDAERRALELAADRRRWEGQVVPGYVLGTWRLKRPVTDAGRVSIIIPTCAARGLIETCIRTIREATAYGDVEIVCIDSIPAENAAAKEWLAKHADSVVQTDEAFNWARYNNLGSAAATGDFLLFLNDDIEVRDPAWLHTLIDYAKRPGVGVVGPQLLYPDGKVQHAGMFLSGSVARHAFRFAGRDEPGPFGLALTDRNVIAVTGACMMMRRATYDALGGFDEAHAVVNNDVDFCLRIWRHGMRVVFTPHVSLVHHELASRARLADVFDKSRFEGEWGTRLAKGDPFFHPALLMDSDFHVPDPEPVELVSAGRLLAHEKVRRILAVKLDHIGDFVLGLPALRLLKQRFPSASVAALVPKASIAMVAIEPAIDECIEFNFFEARSELGPRDVDPAEYAKLAARLRPYEFDVAIDFRVHTDTRHVLRHTGASLLAGFDHNGMFPWLDVSLPWEGDQARQPKSTHISTRLMALVNALDVACQKAPVITTSSPRETALAHLRALPACADAPPGFFERPLVCVHPGVGNRMRQWPAGHFATLIKLLVESEDVHVVLIGGQEEVGLAREIEGLVRQPSALFSLIGRSALRELPEVLQACVLYIGNNSGPKHIAAALGVPTIGIHSGVVDAVEWAPLGPRAVALRRKVSCGPCYLSRPEMCAENLKCINGITPAQVYSACRRLLPLGVPALGDDVGSAM